MKITDHQRAKGRLGKLREMAGFSQTKFAEMVGMSRVGWHRIENGKTVPSLETARAASDALCVTLDTFCSAWEEGRRKR